MRHELSWNGDKGMTRGWIDEHVNIDKGRVGRRWWSQHHRNAVMADGVVVIVVGPVVVR